MTQLDRLETKVDYLTRLVAMLIKSIADEEPEEHSLEGVQVGQRDDTKSLG
jgi:hypothetical protein